MYIIFPFTENKRIDYILFAGNIVDSSNFCGKDSNTKYVVIDTELINNTRCFGFIFGYNQDEKYWSILRNFGNYT